MARGKLCLIMVRILIENKYRKHKKVGYNKLKRGVVNEM